MTFRLQIKCLISIIFIRGGYKNNLFVSLKNAIKEGVRHIGINNFLDYFERKWINYIYFTDLKLYNRIEERISFTNNHAEGYNSWLGRKFATSHPRLISEIRTIDFNKEPDLFKVEIDGVNV